MLNLSSQVLLLVAAMHARLVVHLDLKADNVLIRPPSPTNESNVSLLLGDFGEAMVLGQGAAVAMKQSRGTECIQAPEMLLAGRCRDSTCVLFSDLFAQGRSTLFPSTTVANPSRRRTPPMCGLSDVFSTNCCLEISCLLTPNGRSFLFG